MTNSMKAKKTTIIILSLCVALCSLFALFTQMFVVKAEGETPALPEKLSTFVMGEGASIRCVGEEDETSGIRFTSSISAGEFNSITNNGTLTYDFGMLIAKGNFGSTEQAISILKTNENTNGVKHAAAKYKLDAEKFEYNIAIYDVKDSVKTFAALGYFTVGGKTYYANVVNAGDNIRSLFQVAVGLNTAVEKGIYVADDFEIDYTNSLVDAVMTNETVSLNNPTYSAEIDGEIEISASVGGNKVKPVYVFGEEGIVEEVNGKFIAKKAGTTTVKAVVKGSNDYESVESTITVSKAPIEITDVAGFLALKNAKAEDEYVLANDITITVNGEDSVEEGSDTYWNGSDTHIYCLIQSFAGKLDGNGHKVTIKNTTAFTGGNFAGLFNNVIADAVIENVVFDIQIVNGGNFTHDNFSTLIYKLEGTLKNCYIKTTLDGTAIGSQSSVIRTITTDAVLENNIFETDGKLGCISRDTKYDSYTGAQILVGKPSYYAFGTSNTRYTDMTNLAVYESIGDMLTANEYGEIYVVGSKHSNGHGYAKGSYETRDSKLAFEDAKWTFDYVNREIKLCGKTIIDEKIHITNVSEFLAINNSTGNDEYVLDNDITIKVNGTDTLEEGSDACWKKDSSGTYCLIQSFKGKLNGNGHRVTIINTTAFTGGTFAGVFGNIASNVVIENVVFDIQIVNGGNFTPANFSTLIYKLEGTLKNCYIKTTIDGTAIGSQSSVIRTITTDATLENNIFKTDGKLECVSRDMKYDSYEGAQIVIGKPSNYAFGTSNTRYTDMTNIAVYATISDMLNANENGEIYVVGSKHSNGHGYAKGSYETRDSKLTFEDAKWTFDYEKGELKLCGKIIVFD